ncbi:MAG: cysteinyl-tRNA synthetase [Parcubacteria group bacterium Gr01-1014_29]|nr:MAG: cysteinyl-tRNA synthetase [Parcubacteria group bacterium Gr01-1014_29]
MSLKLYNTFSRKKEVFKPLKKGFVGLYTCGPTVYNYVHIGNLRTYIFEDVLRRTLEAHGYTVQHIMNVTDVDDKTIAASKHAKKDLSVFTKEYEKAFGDDSAKLNILAPTRPFVRATEHIPAMIMLIQKLLRKNYAYEKGGSVYFDISKFAPYGKLAHLDKKGLKAGARIDVDEYAKDAAQDFVLWKAAKAGEPSWPAPFGSGRPGWHIECSAMATAYLKQPFDIHAGGVDLIFPHHENEIAQSEAAYNKPFARYWLHGEHLLVDGEKMSKSLGNTYTLRDIEKKEFTPLSLRYLVLMAHYRTKLNFTWQSLKSAQQAYRELVEFTKELIAEKSAAPIKTAHSYASYEKKFFAALDDDLNTPKALAVLWQFIRAYHKAKTTYPNAAYALLLKCDAVLGLEFAEVTLLKIPLAIQQLAEKREQFRTEKKWQEADALRAKIEKMGWQILDTDAGSTLKPRM